MYKADMELYYTISIHALREEGDITYLPSTLSQPNFYPRPPRGGRLLATISKAPATPISIHALREEGDPLSVVSLTAILVFLSTPSARRATIRP